MMGSLMHRILWPMFPSLFALTAASCGGHAPPPAAPSAPGAPTRNLCAIETKLGLDRPARDRTFPPGYWLALLVRGYQESGDFARPARDCQDQLARLERDGCLVDAQPELLPGRLLTPDDLVVASLDDKRRLVWAMTDHRSDGQAEGPVAIAELGNRGITVRALGVLRAYPHNVALRLERLGQNAVLVADGEHCEAGQAREECARAIRLVPLVGDRFASGPLIDASGLCLGRSFIPVRAQGTAGNDRRIKYRVETLITFTEDTVLFREQLAIDGQPHRSDPSSASYVTRLQADRQVSLRGGELVATGPSLLARWLSRQDIDRAPGGRAYEIR
jgi:hypothetical protein